MWLNTEWCLINFPCLRNKWGSECAYWWRCSVVLLVVIYWVSCRPLHSRSVHKWQAICRENTGDIIRTVCGIGWPNFLCTVPWKVWNSEGIRYISCQFVYNVHIPALFVKVRHECQAESATRRKEGFPPLHILLTDIGWCLFTYTKYKDHVLLLQLVLKNNLISGGCHFVVEMWQGEHFILLVYDAMQSGI